MKRLLTYIFLMLLGTATAQDKSENKADFELGSGLNFSFDNDNYQFNLGGFLQPRYVYRKISETPSTNEMNVKRAYLSLGGKAIQEKISFFVQTDFSLSNPLLDAWVAYHPTKSITFSAGQKRVAFNNREMTYNENQFQFTERSMLSTSLSNTGREFGLFIDGQFSVEDIGISPQIGLTSGDGRNSFGQNARDTDRGGLKYGARLDIYPLGYFKAGNDIMTADLFREETPKLVIGGAVSYNSGASNRVGEGSGSFELFDSEQRLKYPDYRKFYADVLFKYKGFSVLGEYANTSADALQGIFINQAATNPLQPQQISSYLMLGNAYNVQAGYVMKNGFALDLRHSILKPEFDTYERSIMTDISASTIGLSKYLKGNSLKIQTAVSRVIYTNSTETSAELLLQIIF